MKDKDKNEIVASVAIIIHKNSAYYWWGASIDEKEVGINKYLLWKSMNIIKDEYYKMVEMGIFGLKQVVHIFMQEMGNKKD